VKFVAEFNPGHKCKGEVEASVPINPSAGQHGVRTSKGIFNS